MVVGRGTRPQREPSKATCHGSHSKGSGAVQPSRRERYKGESAVRQGKDGRTIATCFPYGAGRVHAGKRPTGAAHSTFHANVNFWMGGCEGNTLLDHRRTPRGSLLPLNLPFSCRWSTTTKALWHCATHLLDCAKVAPATSNPELCEGRRPIQVTYRPSA